MKYAPKYSPGWLSLSCLLLGLFSTGCVTHDELINFRNTDLESQSPEAILNQMELKIQPEDLLRIEVYSFSPEAAAPFNPGILDGSGQRQNQQLQNLDGNQLELFTGYFVDAEGYIDFPVVGRVQVAGLSLEAAKSKLTEIVKEYVSDAVLNMRFLNFKVTVLGEVNNPGTVQLTNKRVTLLEALGYAGDLTIYANRTNLLVMREANGQRTYERLDLQSDEIFDSEFFYLQQNDVIYVSPLQARTATVADPAQRVISYGAAIISIATLIIALTR